MSRSADVPTTGRSLRCSCRTTVVQPARRISSANASRKKEPEMDIEMEAPTDDLGMIDDTEDEYLAVAGGMRSTNDPTAC